MAEKIQRQTQKIFAGAAGDDSLAAFGSMTTGNPIYTDNIEDLQSSAYEQGWEAAIAANEAPFLEEMNGVQYGFSKQLAYLFQNGVPEWDAGTEYFALISICQLNGILYQSLTDNNIGNNPATDTTNWQRFYTGFGLYSANMSYAQNDLVYAVTEEQVSLYLSLKDNNLGNPLTDETAWKKDELGGGGDTVPLFTGMYFDFKPNNFSWLKAGEQQNSGGIYTSCYNTLVNCLTEANNIYDLKVIETSAMEPGVDYSEYWKVNQDDMYFITPTTMGFDVESTVRLYFKVANAVENLELLDAGEVLEALADKTDMAQAARASMPSNRKLQLTLGASGTTYTAPATGWVLLSSTTNASNQLISISSNVVSTAVQYAAGQNFSTNIPVLEGKPFTIWYSTLNSNTKLEFIYAEGIN